MSRLFTEREKQMIIHLLPEEVEEFLGNPIRSICDWLQSYRIVTGLVGGL